MSNKIRCVEIGPDNLDLLLNAEDEMFDNPVKPDQARAFVDDPNHFLIFAMDAKQPVGFASAIINLHPDKDPILFVSEVGVIESHQRRGIATELMQAMKKLADREGCQGIWLATEGDNTPARGLYQSLKGREIKDVVVYDWGDSGEP